MLIKDHKLLERRQELLDYFQSVKKKDNEIFNYMKVLHLVKAGKDESKEDKFTPKLKAELDLYLKMLKADPVAFAEYQMNYYHRDIQRLKQRYPKLNQEEVCALSLLLDKDGSNYGFAQNMHIYYARKMAVNALVCLGAYSGKFHMTNASGPCSIGIDNDFWLNLNCELQPQQQDRLNANHLYLNGSVKTNSFINEPHLKKYLRRCRSKSDKESQTQASFLINRDNKAPHPEHEELASVIYDPGSSISNMIYRLRNHPEWLESDPTIKKIIQHILFKPSFTAKGLPPHIPLFEDIKLHPLETLQQFRKLIEQCLRLHLHEKQSEQVNISSVLYLIKLANQVEKTYQDIHQSEMPIHLYEEADLKCIERTILTSEKISYADYLNFLLHKIDKQTLTSTKSWSDQTWKQVYCNWMVTATLKEYEDHPAVDSELLLEIKRRMLSIGNEFNKLIDAKPKLIQDVLNTVANELGVTPTSNSLMLKRVLKGFYQNKIHHIASKKPLNNRERPMRKNIRFRKAANAIMIARQFTKTRKEKWKKIKDGGLVFKIEQPNHEFLYMNLTSGGVASSKGHLNGQELNFNEPNFIRVFNKRPVRVIGYGNTIYFEDQVYGMCRTLNGGKFIERNIKGQWYRYVDPNHLDHPNNSSGIPEIFKGNFCHWVQDERNHNSTMILSHCETGEDSYEIDQAGLLHPYGKKETLEKLNSGNAGFLYNFEEPSKILCWKDENNRRSKIQFFTYRTKTGQYLSFTEKEGRFYADHNPNFYLENPHQFDFPGEFCNYLLMRHVDGKQQKLLLPVRQLVSTSLATDSAIWLDNTEFNQREYEFMEVNLKEGHLNIDSPSERLLLSRIYATEKKYLLALECLQPLERRMRLSPFEIKLLKWNCNPINCHDYNSNAAALRLRAFWILAINGAIDLGSDPELLKSLEHSLDYYTASYNDLYSSLILPKEMLQFLSKYLDENSYVRWMIGNLLESTNQTNHVVSIPICPDLKLFSTTDILDNVQFDDILTKSNSPFSLPFITICDIFLKGNQASRDALMYSMLWKKPVLPNYAYALIHHIYKDPSSIPPLPPKPWTKQDLAIWFNSLIFSYKSRRIGTTNLFKAEELFDLRYLSGSQIHTHFENPEIAEPAINNNPAILVAYEGQEQLENSLNLIRQRFLVAKPQSAIKATKLDLEKNELSHTEQPMQKIIENEFADFNSSLEIGTKRLYEDLPYEFLQGNTIDARDSLNKLDEKAKQRCTELEENILKEVRKYPIDQKKQMEKSLARVGYAAHDITIMDLARLAGKGDLPGSLQRYKELLPDLTDVGIQHLHLQIIEYMVAQTTLDHIERILEPLNKLDTPQISESEKQALVTEACFLLSQTRSYKPHENVSALYFEYASKCRLREMQATCFDQIVKTIFDAKQNNQLLNKGIVFQMIQGAGKSAVLLSRLMELISETGYLSILVCHHSQIKAAESSMEKYQRERFKKKVVTIDYDESHLEDKNTLIEIQNKLNEVRKNKDSLAVSNVTLQYLQILLVQYLIHRDTAEKDSVQKNELDEKIDLLFSINADILENGVGLFDEVALTLNVLQRVNLPHGERIHVPKTRIDLIQNIFEVLSSDKCEQFLRLSENKQADHLETDYYEKMAPMIADHLCTTNQEILIQNHKSAFKRYLLNDIDKQIELLARGLTSKYRPELISQLTQQQKEDYDFMVYLHKTLKNSSDPDLNEAAELISLAKGVVRKILPVVLKKSFNRDFGYSEINPVQIIPFQGVDTPADTEFGYVIEHLCYCFMAAVCSPFTEKAIMQYVQHLKNLAEKHVALGEKFEDTAEAAEYFQVTGVKLLQAFERSNIAKATANINQSLKKRLEFQNYLASFFVTHYPSYVSSSPLAHVDQFKTVIGCSASIDNAHSYNIKLSEILTEKGADGKVIANLFDRNNDGNDRLNIIKAKELPAMIQECLDPLPPDKVQCLIDGGHLFKQFKSLDMAKEILNYFKTKNNKRIQGVFFYYRPDKSQNSEGNESFALLKDLGNGQTELVFPKSNTRSDIEAHGIPIDNIFFNIDELRATGLDVPMSPDAVGMGTASGESLSSLTQMLMRLRGYFKGQNLALAIGESTQKILLNNDPTYRALVKTSLKNQTLIKSDDTFRSLKEGSQNAIRTQLMHHVLKLRKDKDQASRIVKGYQNFFSTTTSESPYNNFAFIEEEADPDEIINEIGNDQIKQFQAVRNVLDAQSVSTIQKAVQEVNVKLIKQANTVPELKRRFLKTAPNELGLQFKQTEKININIESRQRISLQLSQEEQSYNKPIQDFEFLEVDWNGFAVENWTNNKVGPEIFPVCEILDDIDHTQGWDFKPGLYRTNFSSCFPSNIKLTENLRYTLNQPLPVFHPLQKSCECLLIRKLENNKVECIMLSQKDAHFWKQRNMTPSGVWLMNLEGELIAPSKDPLPDQKEPLFWDEKETALWYANFFNGNVSGLEKRPFLTNEILNTKDNLMQRFLFFRTSQNIIQRQLLSINPLYSLNRNSQELVPMSKARYAKTLEQRRRVEKMTSEQIAKQDYPIENVRFILPEMIVHLSKPEYIRRINRKQINHINPLYVDMLSPSQIVHLENPSLIQALTNTELIASIPDEHAAHLSQAQQKIHPCGIKKLTDHTEIQAITERRLIREFGPLQVVHASPSQIPYIKKEYVNLLRQPEQIMALQGRDQINAIDITMVEYLTNEQVAELRNTKLVKAIPSEKIQYVNNQVVGQLDWKIQLPFITRAQYPYVSQKQYDAIKACEELPLSLRELWRYISPEALRFYKDILAHRFRPNHLGTEWFFVLRKIDTLKDKDYEHLKHESWNSDSYALPPPKEIFKCKNLKTLQFYPVDKSFFDECDFYKYFPKLTSLYINFNEIDEFPASLRGLTELKSLSIAGSKIESIPSWIEEFKKLQLFHMYSGKLKEIPPSIENLTELTHLNVSKNRLTSIPSFKNCTKAEQFHVERNQLDTLPDDFLANAKGGLGVTLDHNSFTTIPKCLIKMCHAHCFYIRFCKLKRIGPEIGDLNESVKRLRFCGNPITEIPKEISKLGIYDLSLAETEIEDLPDSMQNMGLTELDLSFTKITKLPEVLLKLPKLKKIYWKDCKLNKDDRKKLREHAQTKGIALSFHHTADSRDRDRVNSRSKDPKTQDQQPDLSPLQSADPTPETDIENLVKNERVLELIEWINSGGDPNTMVSEDENEQSLLQWAITKAHDKLAEIIIEKGCDFNKLKFDIPPISILCQRPVANAKLITLLMQKLNQKELSIKDASQVLEKAVTSKNYLEQYALYQLLQPLINKFPSDDLASRILKRAEKIKGRTLFKRFLTWFGEGLRNILMRYKMNRALDHEKRAIRNKKPVVPVFDKIAYALFHFNQKFILKINSVNSQIDLLAKGQISVEEAEKNSGVPRLQLLALARKSDLHAAVAQIMISDIGIDPKHNQIKTVTNLCLDKTLIMDTAAEAVAVHDFHGKMNLYGMRAHIAGMAVAKGLNAMLENSTSTVPLEFMKRAKKELYYPLIQTCYWEKMLLFKENEKQVVEEILQALAKLGEGERVLIPTGDKAHNVLIQVKRTTKDNYSLKVFNAVPNQYHNKRGERFNTCLSFNNLSKEVVLNSKGWDAVIGFTGKEHFSKIYALIYEELLKKEPDRSVKDSGEDSEFSTGQLQNTCSASPWWHWLRHEVMDMVAENGDRWAAYVGWRLIKKEIRKNILSDLNEGEPNSLESRVHQATTRKIQKHAQLASLMEIANDAEKFNSTILQMRKLLEPVLTSEALFEKLGYTKNNRFDFYKYAGQRWRILHELSNTIAQEALLNKSLKQQLIQKKDDKAFQFTFLTLSDIEHSKTCLNKMISDLAKENRWNLLGHTLGGLVCDPKLWMLSFDLCKKWLAEGPVYDKNSNIDNIEAVTRAQHAFLKVLDADRRPKRILRELAVHFRKQKKPEMAQSFWDHYCNVVKDRIFAELEDEVIDPLDVPYIASKAEEMPQIMRMLLALSKYTFDNDVIKIIHKLVAQAMTFDDENYTMLKDLATNLHAFGHTTYAQYIEGKIKKKI